MKHTLLTLGIIALMCSCSRQESLTCMETINNLEDMREWMESDIEQNYVASIHGATYLQVIDESIINLYQNK